jgi:hypothetical protein
MKKAIHRILKHDFPFSDISYFCQLVIGFLLITQAQLSHIHPFR